MVCAGAHLQTVAISLLTPAQLLVSCLTIDTTDGWIGWLVGWMVAVCVHGQQRNKENYFVFHMSNK